MYLPMKIEHDRITASDQNQHYIDASSGWPVTLVRGLSETSYSRRRQRERVLAETSKYLSDTFTMNM